MMGDTTRKPSESSERLPHEGWQRLNRATQIANLNIKIAALHFAIIGHRFAEADACRRAERDEQAIRQLQRQIEGLRAED